MIRPFLPPLLLALAPPAAALAAQTDGAPVELAQLMIHERITIRLPRVAPDPPPPRAEAPPIEWRETSGPKCIASSMLVGAAIEQPGTIDLMTNDGGRIRAHFDGSCQALAYYSGFYIRAGADGSVCAHRESIRSRTGESCPIVALRKLKPSRRHRRLP